MTVTVYTKEGCPPCKATKRAFTNKGIEFQELSIENTPGARDMLKELGYMQAPVVVTEDGHWSGYRPDRIAEIASRFETANAELNLVK